MSEAPVLEAHELEMTYRDFWGRRRHRALRGISFQVGPGESHALLGPNGSGKTTALRLLLGLLRPTGGRVRLFGGDPRRAASRDRVGFLPEQSSLHGFLTCQETVELFGQVRGLGRRERRRVAGELLDRVALGEASRRRAHELSHGMRRRLGLAVALVGRPELLILDEPTSGMDPLVREAILDLLREHVEAGRSLLVTSHLLGDIAGIASRATLIARGEVVRRGELGELLRRDGLRTYVVRGGSELDDAVARTVEAAGAELLESGPARRSIEQLFLETYRRTDEEPDASQGA